MHITKLVFRRNFVRMVFSFIGMFSFVFFISNLFALQQTKWVATQISTLMSQKLDTRFTSVRVFLATQIKQLKKQDDVEFAMERVNELEQLTGNAYSVGSDFDLELDKNKLIWIWPSEMRSWEGHSRPLSDVLGLLRLQLVQQHSPTHPTLVHTHDNHTNTFQSIANSILGNKKQLKVVFLTDGFAFGRLGKDVDIVTVFLGWQRFRTHIQTDRFGVKHLADQRPGLLSDTALGYYTCTATGKHHQFSKTRFLGNSQEEFSCQSKLDVLEQPTPTFDKRYFTYHEMRHNMVMRSTHVLSRDEDTARDEWDISCLYCHKHPHFVTYTHIISHAILDENGAIYTKSLKIIPLMWVEHKKMGTQNVDLLVGTYRHYKDDTMYTMLESLCTLSEDDFKDVKHSDITIRDEIFSISVKFSYINYGHSLLESFTRLSMYVPFLQKHPQIAIHVGNIGFLKPLLPIFRLKNELISGVSMATRVYLPEGNPPYAPSVHYLQLTAHFAHQHLHSLPEFKDQSFQQDTLIYIKRSERRTIKQDNIVHSFLEETAKRYQLKFALFGDEHGGHDIKSTMLLFHKAVLVIGAHGAGLSNVLFAQPHTSIIEIQCPPPWTASTFRHLTYKLGMRFHSLMGHPVDGFDPLSSRPSTEHCDKGLKIHNVDELKRTILKMLEITLNDVRNL